MDVDILNRLLSLRDQVQAILDSTTYSWDEKYGAICGGTLFASITEIIPGCIWYDSNMTSEQNLTTWFGIVQDKIAQIQSQE